MEARLVHEVWERRQSLFPLLEIRKESLRGVEAGDKASAIRYAASCVALIAHKVCRDSQEKEVWIDHWTLLTAALANHCSDFRYSKTGATLAWSSIAYSCTFLVSLA